MTKVIIPLSIQQNLLAKKIVVVDGGDDGNPPVVPPDGGIWHCLSVLDGTHLHIQDESNPFCLLTFSRVDGALPFIRMPCDDALYIVANIEERERLKKTPLIRSNCEHIFGDYGRLIMFTLAGVQVSGNKQYENS